jgi:hypothetical protein
MVVVQKNYKIIVGSATDTMECLLYSRYRGNKMTFTIELPPIEFARPMHIRVWFPFV